MKKYLSFWRAFTMFTMVSCFLYEAKAQLIGVWSGTVSMKIRSEGMIGWGETNINTTFTDNKGNGTIKHEAEGKLIPGKGSCHGQGVAELHDVTFTTDNTYRIYVIGPECSNGPDPNTNFQHDIEIADEPIPANPKHLQGTRKTVLKLDNLGSTGTITLTWDLTMSVDAELIVTPSQYDTWLPEPGKDETTVGTIMNISLKLQSKTGKPLTTKAKKFVLRLSNTSKEPGITINFPLAPATPSLPDLRFLFQLGADTSEQGQLIVMNCQSGCLTGNVKIGSYDGGGWTTLTAIAILDDDTRVSGNLLVSGGEIETRLPKREIGSKIATSWLKANGNPNEMDDLDSSKGNDNVGDGFTAYEEYRGVISELQFGKTNPNKFGRLDPWRKELGILASQPDFSLFAEGIGWFKNASGLEIIRFDFNKDEIASDGKINSNAKSANDFDQYALYLLNGGLKSGVLGRVYSRANHPDIPAQIVGVVVNWSFVSTAYQDMVNSVKPERLKFTLSDYLAQTVAHELGHAVNIWHHGDESSPFGDYIVNDLSDNNRIFDRNGNLITTRSYTLSSIGDRTGTAESGDLSCMLNYYPYFNWGYTTGIGGANIFNQEPLLPLGKIFCKSKKGTGINATQLYFGDADATKGNCLGQIKLRN